MHLGHAHRLFLGSAAVDKVYCGQTPVWPSVLFQDNFNRTNANLEDSPVSSSGKVWEHDGEIAGALAIFFSSLRCNTTNSAGSAYKCPDLGSADHYVQFEVPATNVFLGSFICVRLADRNNFLGVRVGRSGVNGVLEVWRRVNGTLTARHNPGGTAVNVLDTVRLAAVGSNWQVFVNGASIATGTIGATLTATQAGVVARQFATDTLLDAFEANAL